MNEQQRQGVCTDDPEHPDLARLLNPSQLPSLGRSASTEWGPILQPYLAAALQRHGEYTLSAIEQHLNFFMTHVVPWMGLGPAPDPKTGVLMPPYPGSLTNDHTPFELSCCWKENRSKGRAVVRYVIDVIPSSAEISRVAALREALHVMGMLEEISQELNPREDSLSLYAFPSLWWQITKAMLGHEEQTHVHPCTRCSPSGVFIAFDLVASAVFAKAYWLFPACHQTSTLVSSMQKILQASEQAEPALFPRLLANWAKVAAHINAHPDILQPRMLSIDATRYPVPRVKIYARRLFVASNTFQDIEPHLSLDGRIPLSEKFRQSCERLWSSLVGPEDVLPGTGPKYTLLLYDLSTGTSGEPLVKDVSAKLYIMCQEIPRVDSFVAQKLYENCPVLQDAELVKELAASVEPTAFICEIGLAPGKGETEVTVYCSPCWWSRKTWKDCVEKDGRLKKVRRVIAPR